jgi:hypothetical protein
MMKALTRMKDKRSSRSNSIMDGMDEDEDDEQYYDSYQDGEAFFAE